MPSERAIGAVLLDVGGVFLSPGHDLIGPVIVAAGGDGSAAALDRAHYAGIAELDAGDGADWAAYHRGVAASAGVPVRARAGVVTALGGALNSAGVWRRLVPGSVEGLRRLADTGVPLGVVSNSDGTVEELLRLNRICQVGAGHGVPVLIIVDSGTAGFAKPDARIFVSALQCLGVPPDRVVHVGDTVFADVRGAVAAGIRPLHLDPYGFCRRDRGDHEHVRSLAEVAALVMAGRSSA
jgi:putative hydrolase of the HAD superfamily